MLASVTSVYRPKIVAVIGIVVLLLGSIPTPPHPTTAYIGAVAVPIWLLLIKYGPPTRVGAVLRVVLLGAVTIFVASQVNAASDKNDWIVPVVIVVIAGVLILSVLVAKYPPWSRRVAILRRSAFTSIAVFAVSIYCVVRSGYSLMWQGCFFTVDLPFRQMILLPWPYDYYVVHLFLPILCVTSLTVPVVSSASFVLMRRVHVQRERIATDAV